MNFFEEIVSEMRKMPLSNLLRIVPIIRGAATKVREPVVPIDEIINTLVNLEGTEANKLELIERAMVAAAIKQCKNNVSAAARLLNVDRKAIERRVVSYGINTQWEH